LKDHQGNVWLSDQGFDGGETIERSDIQIANTTGANGAARTLTASPWQNRIRAV